MYWMKTAYKTKKKDIKSTGKFVPKNVPNIIIHDPMENCLNTWW